MKLTATPLAVALSLAFGSTLALAQGLPQATIGRIADGSSNTNQVGAVAPQSLVTQGTVSGNVTQSSNQTSFGAFSAQTVSIGGARGLSNATGNLSANGTLTGNVTQQRSGSPGNNTSGSQSLTIGGLAGAVSANNVSANGTVAAAVSQASQGNSRGIGNQVVDAGGVRDSTGGSLTTLGVITGDGVTQTSRNVVGQELRVGSIANANLQTGQATGIVSARITQTTGAIVNGLSSRVQSIGVGDIRDSQALSVTTLGTLAGSVTQTQNANGSANQSVEIGSVSQVDAGGNITTNGAVASNVSQTTQNGIQRLLVAAVVGGSPSFVDARGVLNGDVSQSQSTAALSLQRIAVGAVEGSTGSVRTDATVSNLLTQTLSGSGANRTQSLSIGSAEQTQGTVVTRAAVSGTVNQVSTSTQGSASQRINIGSAQNTGSLSVRTDATVTGNLVQTASASSRENQSILIGGVIGN